MVKKTSLVIVAYDQNEKKKNKNTRYKGTTHFLIRYAQFIRSVVSKRFFIIVMNMYSNIIEEK